MKLYETIFMVEHEGEYTTYLQIHPEGDFEDGFDAEEAAYDHIEKVFGIKSDKLRLITVDEIG